MGVMDTPVRGKRPGGVCEDDIKRLGSVCVCAEGKKKGERKLSVHLGRKGEKANKREASKSES